MVLNPYSFFAMHATIPFLIYRNWTTFIVWISIVAISAVQLWPNVTFDGSRLRIRSVTLLWRRRIAVSEVSDVEIDTSFRLRNAAGRYGIVLRMSSGRVVAIHESACRSDAKAREWHAAIVECLSATIEPES